MHWLGLDWDTMIFRFHSVEMPGQPFNPAQFLDTALVVNDTMLDSTQSF